MSDQEREREWEKECDDNWDKAAAELDADGWQRVEGRLTHWLKDGQKVVLRRELGSSNWTPKHQ